METHFRRKHMQRTCHDTRWMETEMQKLLVNRWTLNRWTLISVQTLLAPDSRGIIVRQQLQTNNNEMLVRGKQLLG